MTAATALIPVDRVEVLTVVDNVTDLLLPSTPVARRLGAMGPGGDRMPSVEAPLVESGRAPDALEAEHGLALLVQVTSGGSTRKVLLDTGSTVRGLVRNLDRMGVDLADIEAVVLSHGHFDHTMGLNGLAERCSPPPALVAHPDAWLERRIALPGREAVGLPTTRRDRVVAAGFRLIEQRGPLSLLDGCLLVTGEIERTTDFERGLVLHQARREGGWQPDPWIRDDQALVAHVRDRGLVVMTGCGHAGIVNTLRHARALTGVDRVHAVIGGFHLGGPAFEHAIDPTVEALVDLAPQVIAPTHCTGWRATHALAAAFPEAFVPGSVGTTYVLESGASEPQSLPG